MKVYLAGNIAHLTFEETSFWRKEVTTRLKFTLDPLRGKEHLAGTIVGFIRMFCSRNISS
jgi:hypothetical protein